MVAVVASTACNERHSRAAPSPTEVSPPRTSTIVCDSTSHDFGDVVQGARLTHGFPVKNSGSLPLSIERVEKSYSCVVVDPPTPLELAPGASAVLQVDCDTRDRQQWLKEALVVHSNDRRAPELTLGVAARIEPLLALTSILVELTTAFGGKRTEDVRLQGRLASEAKLELQQVEGTGPKVMVLSGNGGEAQRLRLTLAGKQVGTGVGRIFLSTGLENPSQLVLSYSWRVTGNLEVDPSNPYLNLRELGPKEVVLRVKSSRADFRLDAVRVAQGPFEARFQPDQAAGGYTVSVRAIEGRISDDERGVPGKILLVSNDPAEPHKQVDVFAFGRVNRSNAEADAR
jgi:hypothetical protein